MVKRIFLLIMLVLSLSSVEASITLNEKTVIPVILQYGNDPSIDYYMSSSSYSFQSYPFYISSSLWKDFKDHEFFAIGDSFKYGYVEFNITKPVIADNYTIEWYYSTITESPNRWKRVYPVIDETNNFTSTGLKRIYFDEFYNWQSYPLIGGKRSYYLMAYLRDVVNVTQQPEISTTNGIMVSTDGIEITDETISISDLHDFIGNESIIEELSGTAFQAHKNIFLFGNSTLKIIEKLLIVGDDSINEWKSIYPYTYNSTIQIGEEDPVYRIKNGGSLIYNNAYGHYGKLIYGTWKFYGAYYKQLNSGYSGADNRGTFIVEDSTFDGNSPFYAGDGLMDNIGFSTSSVYIYSDQYEMKNLFFYNSPLICGWNRNPKIYNLEMFDKDLSYQIYGGRAGAHFDLYNPSGLNNSKFKLYKWPSDNYHEHVVEWYSLDLTLKNVYGQLINASVIVEDSKNNTYQGIAYNGSIHFDLKYRDTWCDTTDTSCSWSNEPGCLGEEIYPPYTITVEHPDYVTSQTVTTISDPTKWTWVLLDKNSYENIFKAIIIRDNATRTLIIR